MSDNGNKVSELGPKRRRRRMREVDERLDAQREELLAWLRAHFAAHPAPSKSYEALIMAEMLAMADDPEHLWRIKDPAAFLGLVSETARQGLADTCRRLMTAFVDHMDGAPPRDQGPPSEE